MPKKQEKTQSENKNEMSTPGSDITKMFKISGRSLIIIMFINTLRLLMGNISIQHARTGRNVSREREGLREN